MEETIISDIEEIHIQCHTLARWAEESYRNARKMALHRFGIDDNGHSTRIESWERTNCEIIVKMTNHYMVGWGIHVTFEAWCIKYIEEDEEETSEDFE